MPVPDTGSARDVARKAFKGALALGVRQIMVYGANILGGILLARLLTPAEFGLFAIVTFLLGFLVGFGGTGLAANLIRQDEEPSEADYRAVFTAQQAVVALIVVFFWLASPWIAAVYGLPPSDVWIFRLVAISLLITSFMVVPQVRLERSLDFDKLAVVEVGQALVFNGTAVFLAYRGMGAMSFALAMLLRALSGAILTNLLNPWPLRWRWDWLRARRHLRFGLYYQGGQLVSVLKDSINPVFIGLLLGAVEVGYVTWAVMVAAYPVLALMILQRIYMPTFARMQAYPEQLARFVEQAIWATNVLTAPLAVLTLIFIDPLTQLVFGEKWLVALPLFYLLWASNLIAPTAAPLMGLLNAVGKSRTTFGLAFLWMASTWAFGLPTIYWLGAIGYPVANLFVLVLGNSVLFYVAKRTVSIELFAAIYPAWLAVLLAGMVTYLSQQFWTVTTFPEILLASFGLIILYILGLRLISPKRFYGAWRVALGSEP